jgi:hypothetical protein
MAQLAPGKDASNDFIERDIVIFISLESGRPRLEALWRGMNDLMRRSYRDTRQVYLLFLARFANTPDGVRR